MNQHLIKEISSQIYKRFPEVEGCKPKIKLHGKNQHLLIFHGSGKTANGHSIPRIVRVVVNRNGKISKTTTSR